MSSQASKDGSANPASHLSQAAEFAVGSSFEGTVADLSRGGAGLLRLDGRVVFVPFTAPGDQVRFEIVAIEKRWAQGRLLEVISPSPHRVAPRCPVFGRCGGCQWQHLPYEFQWKTKLSGAQHALQRVGLQPEEAEWLAFPATQVWEYRNRIQLRGDDQNLGFFESGSRNRVSVDRCDIARSEINGALPSILKAGRALFQKNPVEYKVEVEVLTDGRIRENWNSRHAAAGFRQVHDQQNEVLQKAVAHLLEWVTPIDPSEHLLDLYGGSGNLSLPLVSRFSGVDCVDTGAPRRAPDGTPAHFRFHAMPVHHWIRKTKPVAIQAQKRVRALIDPPRAGLGEDASRIVEGLKRWGVQEIVAVGCDADSWARDVARLVRAGWTLQKAGALDLFPQTPHVESLALLVKKN